MVLGILNTISIIIKFKESLIKTVQWGIKPVDMMEVGWRFNGRAIVIFPVISLVEYSCNIGHSAENGFSTCNENFCKLSKVTSSDKKLEINIDVCYSKYSTTISIININKWFSTQCIFFINVHQMDFFLQLIYTDHYYHISIFLNGISRQPYGYSIIAMKSNNLFWFTKPMSF